MTDDALNGGLAEADDLFLAEPPPFDWVREGTSTWLFADDGAFGIPRNGIEAEPHRWADRRYMAKLAFADGRVLVDGGVGAMAPTLDARGRPSILGAGPLRYECIEPFRRWRVRYDGSCVDTNVAAQIAQAVDAGRRTPVRYEVELTMEAPAFPQDVSPAKFQRMPKGVRYDALSVGLGLRFEQLLRGDGELTIDGATRSFRCSGMRVKRRSVRTDALFLRGHCWQSALFPDGSGFGYLAYPRHADGNEGWNDGFIYRGGIVHPARATVIPWLREAAPSGQDVSLELESAAGTVRIAGRTGLSTFQVSSGELWGLTLQQTGVRYTWDGATAWGMLERSAVTEAHG